MRKQKQRQTHIYVGLLVFVVCWIISSASHAWQPEVGDKPSPMEQLELVNGQPVNLSNYAGKPLVIYFGADWCAPCIENGRPAVLGAFQKYRNKGLQVLFVDLDDPFKLRGKKITESKEMGFPIAMRTAPTGDKEKLRNFDFGGFGRIQVIPTAILLDRSGKVVNKIEQGTKLRDELDGAVASLVR